MVIDATGTTVLPAVADVRAALASDMFTQMRTLPAVRRMRAVHDAAHGTGDEPARATTRTTTRDVLDFATPSGARTLRLDGATGSITPGKQAGLVVGTGDLNTMPPHDPVGTLVLGADRGNTTPVRRVAGRAAASGPGAWSVSIRTPCAPRCTTRSTG